MTDPGTLRKYRAERAKGLTASYSLRSAKARSAEPAYPFLAELDYSRPVTGTIGPFTVKVEVVSDEDSRLGEDDVTGMFTDTFEKGCVKNTVRDWGTDYEYYRPSNYALKHAYDDFRMAGMSKSVARAAVAERVQREMYDDANRNYFGVIVTVSLGSHELGGASLWGIDTVPGYDGQAYFIEVAEELIHEATYRAHKAVPAALERNTAEAAALRAALIWTPEKGA